MSAECFDNGVGEEGGGDLFELRGGQVAFEDERAGLAHVANRREPQRLALTGHPRRLAIRQMCRRIDLNFPNHIPHPIASRLIFASRNNSFSAAASSALSCSGGQRGSVCCTAWNIARVSGN